MDIKIELNEEQVIEAASNEFKDDVEFLFKLLDESTTSYEPWRMLIGKMYNHFDTYERNCVIEMIEEIDDRENKA